MDFQTVPRLIDTSTRSFLQVSLQKCHDNRVALFTFFLNIAVLVIFVGIFGLALYFCRKKKLTPEEEYYKMKRDQEYILAKIRYYQNDVLKPEQLKTGAPITNLPLT
jgi:hypothetical protein